MGATGTLAGQSCGAPVLSSSQLQALAIGAGFPASLAPQMAAIALRESAGCPTAYNPVPPDNSYGLWQINILGNPGLLDALGLSDPTQLFDPATNAAAAAYLYGGNPNNINIAWAATAGPPTSTLGLPDLTASLTALPSTLDLSSLTTMDPVTLGIFGLGAGLALYLVFG